MDKVAKGTKYSGSVSMVAVGWIIWFLLIQGACHGEVLTVGPSEDYMYTTIQRAIEEAKAGDVVEVYPGLYREHVEVKVPVTLRGVGGPIVDAGRAESAITIRAGGVFLEGFVAQNSTGFQQAGIKVVSGNNTLRGNNLKGNSIGILLVSCGDNVMSENRAEGNGYGFLLENSAGNLLSQNLARDNLYGMLLDSSGQNIIRDNRLLENRIGLYFYQASPGNTVFGNVLENNLYGVWLERSSKNSLYLNEFWNNGQNALSKESDNLWTSPLPMRYGEDGIVLAGYLGNLWSDYSGKDLNNDTVGDTPYPFGDDQDPRPLMRRLASGLELKALATPSEGAPGTQVEFYIDVTNSGDLELPLVKVKDLLPFGLEYLSDDDQGKVEGDQISWEINHLLPGSTRHILLRTMISGSRWGLLTSSFNTTAIPLLGGGLAYQDIVDVRAFWAGADVSIDAAPEEVAFGSFVWFVINISNPGEYPLENVTAEVSLPQGLRYVSSRPQGLVAQGNITWSRLGSLASGETTSINMVAEIDGSREGLLVSGVNVTAIPPSGYHVSDQAKEEIRVLKADADIYPTAAPLEGAAGTEVGFHVEVVNPGDVPLHQVKVQGLLPQGLYYLRDNSSGQALGSVVTWDFDHLLPGERRVIDLRALIDGSVLGRLLSSFNVTANPPTGRGVEDDAKVELLAQGAELEVWAEAMPKSGPPGTEVQVLINLVNLGGIKLDQIRVQDLLPLGLEYVGDNSSGRSQGNLVTWELDSLLPGERRSIRLNALINGSAYGVLAHQVNVTAQPPTGYQVTAQFVDTIEALNRMDRRSRDLLMRGAGSRI